METVSKFNPRAESNGTHLAITVKLSKSLLFWATVQKHFRSPLYWIASLALIGIVLTELKGNPFATVAAVFAGLIILISMPISATRSSTKNPAILASITYLFDNFGVLARFTNGEVRSDWSLVVGAFETATSVFVVMQRGSFHLVPKTQVDENELIFLRQILHSKLGAKARQVRPV